MLTKEHLNTEVNTFILLVNQLKGVTMPKNFLWFFFFSLARQSDTEYLGVLNFLQF